LVKSISPLQVFQDSVHRLSTSFIIGCPYRSFHKQGEMLNHQLTKQMALPVSPITYLGSIDIHKLDKC
jgi:hypothetical protein